MVTHKDRKRLRFRRRERLFWVWLYRIWPGCLETLAVFKADTLVRWQQRGFRLYWKWKSRRNRGGRTPVSREVRALIRRLSRENPLWGAPRLHGELQMLGIQIAQTTVARYMIRHRKPPSQTWRTFLDNHAKDLVSIDFFTVPTATFRILYVLLVLRHERRQVVHFNITEHPTGQWTAQQMLEAFPWDQAPRYLLRDRDDVYDTVTFTSAVPRHSKPVMMVPPITRSLYSAMISSLPMPFCRLTTSVVAITSA